jgi:hypothetical protein
MEEGAEAVASDDWTGAAGRLGNGRALSKPLVRPRCVVVVHELSEYVVELARPKMRW